MIDPIEDLKSRLRYFDILRLRPPAPQEAITAAEISLGFQLSPQHRLFLRTYNGGYITDYKICGVQLLEMRRIPKMLDLAAMRDFFSDDPMWPKSWLYIGEDRFGDYYVMDISQSDDKDEHPVLLVDHEALGTEDAAELIASDYLSFLHYVIDEAINLYLPNGKLKSLT